MVIFSDEVLVIFSDEVLVIFSDEVLVIISGAGETSRVTVQVYVWIPTSVALMESTLLPLLLD